MAAERSKKLNLDIPYVPSTEEKVAIMLELAAPRSGMKAADLGSGDGRIVMALAKRGVFVDGYELHPERVAASRQKIAEAGLEEYAAVYEQSFWNVDIHDYDLIMLYGITSMMARLETKLQAELAPGTKVVSNIFTFPNWHYMVERNGIYLYKR